MGRAVLAESSERGQPLAAHVRHSDDRRRDRRRARLDCDPGLRVFAIVLFIAGWVLQFIGHAVEGKPPEFFSDWRFLFVGLRWWLAKLSAAPETSLHRTLRIDFFAVTTHTPVMQYRHLDSPIGPLLVAGDDDGCGFCCLRTSAAASAT
jgi:hypothetical protein